MSNLLPACLQSRGHFRAKVHVSYEDALPAAVEQVGLPSIVLV
jgi:hypothetical protein